MKEAQCYSSLKKIHTNFPESGRLIGWPGLGWTELISVSQCYKYIYYFRRANKFKIRTIFCRNLWVGVGLFGLSFTDRYCILYRGSRHWQNIFIHFYLFREYTIELGLLPESCVRSHEQTLKMSFSFPKSTVYEQADPEQNFKLILWRVASIDKAAQPQGHGSFYLHLYPNWRHAKWNNFWNRAAGQRLAPLRGLRLPSVLSIRLATVSQEWTRKGSRSKRGGTLPALTGGRAAARRSK